MKPFPQDFCPQPSTETGERGEFIEHTETTLMFFIIQREN
jgi:hypothetical protein